VTRRCSAAVALCLAAVVGLAPTAASGQLELSGQMDLLGTVRSDTLHLNTALRGDSPFSPVRVRMFARHWLTDRIGIFAEVLYDFEASVRINGAYAVINDIGGQPWLNARLGLAPNLVGSFGLRSTYFNANPLVGVPLVWQYRTNLSPDGTSTAAALAAIGSDPGTGVPILYDSCWNIQWELLGEVGRLEYSIGMTPGALSNPIKARGVQGSQWLARIGVSPFAGLRLGLSGAHGPYLSKPTPDGTGALPYAADPADFDQSLLGADLELLAGAWAVSAEAHAVRYETPLINEDLEALGGFVEVRFDFLPGWYVAGRAGGLFFDEIVTDPTSGARAPWDRDTHRTEMAVGRRLTREVLVKVDWQRTAVPDGDFDQNLFAAQLSAVF